MSEIMVGDYEFPHFSCKPGDVMIDIGTHVGMISILYAKLYPWLKIYSFEPIPDNYAALLKNIEMNCVTNIIPMNLAVTKDGRTITMNVNFTENSGAATQVLTGQKEESKIFTIPSITLNEFFFLQNIDKCKHLKIDCEGSEYEILLNTAPHILKNFEYVSGEFHITEELEKEGYSIRGLAQHLLLHNPKIKTRIAPLKRIPDENDPTKTIDKNQHNDEEMKKLEQEIQFNL